MAIYYRYVGNITKPSNVTWWSVAFPDLARERIDSLKVLNLANPWVATIIDANNESYEMYFATVEDFDTFMAASRSLSSTPIWHEYNHEHGIVETTSSGFIEINPVNLPTGNVS
jgi:hypothetical protein